MNVVDLAKRSVTAFGDDKVTRLASSISFAAIFSIAPLFIVLIAILGAVAGGHGAAGEQLFSAIRRSAGPGAADQVKQIVASSFNKPRQGFIAQTIGWITFIIGAGNLFAALQDALNSIWHVEKNKGGWRQMVRDRVASLGMIVVVGGLLVLTFAANAAVAYVTQDARTALGLAVNPVLLTIATQVLSLAVEALVFALIFKVLPDVTIEWKHAFEGGAFTAALFTVGQVLIGIYFTRGGVATAYGAAGSLLVALLWIYYSTLILLFGAEVTKVSADHVALNAPASVRDMSDRPAGSDPRTVPKPPQRA